MTSPPSLEIHEFSTGIQAERTADGGWISRGFTGTYMNATINPIPDSVRISIENKEFKVAEGASREQPTIIGRVIKASPQEQKERIDYWSVVAIVTRGKDEVGRGFSAYRYFLAEGQESLNHIVNLLYKLHKSGNMPVFNPFKGRDKSWKPKVDTLALDSDTKLQIERWVESHQDYLKDPTIPILISPNTKVPMSYGFLTIHLLATQKAEMNQELPAWAFYVEALEQPFRFHVVYPASPKAFELLDRMKSNAANIVQVQAPDFDEEGIKRAIRNLIGSAGAKSEHVLVFVNALRQQNVSPQHWASYFNAQGADKAIRGNMHGSRETRLLTLMALAIPETFPEYLKWLARANKAGNDQLPESARFQERILTSLARSGLTHDGISHKQVIEQQAREGAELSLLEVIQLESIKDTKEIIKTIKMLRDVEKGRGFLGRYFFESIDNDLRKMQEFASSSARFDSFDFERRFDNLRLNLNSPEWKDIWLDLGNCWNHRYTLKPSYLPFAELFESLRCWEIAAFFYQVSEGEVPKRLYNLYKKYKYLRKGSAYGIEIAQKEDLADKICQAEIPMENWRNWMRIIFVCLILSFGFVAGFFTRGFFIETSAENVSIPDTAETSTSSGGSTNDTANSSTTTQPERKIPEEILQEAKANFEITKEGIKYVVTQVEQEFRDQGKSIDKNEDIVPALKKTLNDNAKELQYGEVIEDTSIDNPQITNLNKQKKIWTEDWIEAIYLYQERKGIHNENEKPDAIVNQGGKTANSLIDDVLKELESDLPPSDGKT